MSLREDTASNTVGFLLKSFFAKKETKAKASIGPNNRKDFEHVCWIHASFTLKTPWSLAKTYRTPSRKPHGPSITKQTLSPPCPAVLKPLVKGPEVLKAPVSQYGGSKTHTSWALQWRGPGEAEMPRWRNVSKLSTARGNREQLRDSGPVLPVRTAVCIHAHNKIFFLFSL